MLQLNILRYNGLRNNFRNPAPPSIQLPTQGTLTSKKVSPIQNDCCSTSPLLTVVNVAKAPTAMTQALGFTHWKAAA